MEPSADSTTTSSRSRARSAAGSSGCCTLETSASGPIPTEWTRRLESTRARAISLPGSPSAVRCRARRSSSRGTTRTSCGSTPGIAKRSFRHYARDEIDELSRRSGIDVLLVQRRTRGREVRSPPARRGIRERGGGPRRSARPRSSAGLLLRSSPYPARCRGRGRPLRRTEQGRDAGEPRRSGPRDSWTRMVAPRRVADARTSCQVTMWRVRARAEQGAAKSRSTPLKAQEGGYLLVAGCWERHEPCRAPEFGRDHIPSGQTDRSSRG